jgi:hypothetical protein
VICRLPYTLFLQLSLSLSLLVRKRSLPVRSTDIPFSPRFLRGVSFKLTNPEFWGVTQNHSPGIRDGSQLPAPQLRSLTGRDRAARRRGPPSVVCRNRTGAPSPTRRAGRLLTGRLGIDHWEAGVGVGGHIPNHKAPLIGHRKWQPARCKCFSLRGHTTHTAAVASLSG